MTAQEMLDQLAEFYAQKDLIEAHEQDAINAVLTPEIMQQVEDIKAEFAVQRMAVDENIASLEAEAKTAVIAEGKTVKGAHLQAVWNKGRVSWDSKTLEGLAIVFPKVLEAKKEGQPSVSIRKIG